VGEISMRVIENISVPTGNILIVEGSKGKLECLSLGDYGKDVNLNQRKKVVHTDLLPLREKWVVTISTQYGCSMGCTFCDVPKVGPGVNATYDDLLLQVRSCLSLHPEVTATKRLNIHFARMGEPTFNFNILMVASLMKQELRPFIGKSLIHPVVSTMLPRKNKGLMAFLNEWMEIKNYEYHGDAGLQFSINSTSDTEREAMFSGNSLSLDEISKIGKWLEYPKGRKITLNFAVAGWGIDAEKLRDLFNPNKFIVKLTPMHKTAAASRNGVKTEGDYTDYYPYAHHEEALKKAGFEVLTFIASREEDAGRITCGNAILSGTRPFDLCIRCGEKPVNHLDSPYCLECQERVDIGPASRILREARV
jgi:23S rRNA (adenine2503-C2)-methyltransferase